MSVCVCTCVCTRVCVCPCSLMSACSASIRANVQYVCVRTHTRVCPSRVNQPSNPPNSQGDCGNGSIHWHIRALCFPNTSQPHNSRCVSSSQPRSKRAVEGGREGWGGHWWDPQGDQSQHTLLCPAVEALGGSSPPMGRLSVSVVNEFITRLFDALSTWTDAAYWLQWWQRSKIMMRDHTVILYKHLWGW